MRQQVEHIGDAIGRKIDLEVISVEDAPVELGKTMPPNGPKITPTTSAEIRR